MFRCLLVLLAVIGISPLVEAQHESPARYQLYGGYSFLSNSFNGVPGARQPLHGWDSAIGFSSWHGLRFKIDVSGYRGTNLGAQQNAMLYMAGGQYNWRVRRETVFVEGLGGELEMNRYWGANQARGELASFTSYVGGGLDTPLTRQLALRIGGGFQYENLALISTSRTNEPDRIPGLPNFFGRLSAGMVWNF